jgi:adenosylmethionine-8-amino-7-oxononanoate aminotransferase
MILPSVTMTRQILTIQKTLVNNSFRTLALMQERGDQVARSFLASGGKESADTQRLWEQWSQTGQAGREALVTAADTYFGLLEGMLSSGDNGGR